MTMSLENEIEEFLVHRNVLKVGFATLETLAGGPRYCDISYVLPEARSAISFALPLNREYIRHFLAKKNRALHEQDNFATSRRARDISWDLADFLKRKGYAAKGTAGNFKYRKNIPGWQFSMPPQIAHMYIAVRSGVGSFGWSGNVGMEGHGTAILLGTCVTSAVLAPTDSISEEKKFCFNCKICASACAAERIHHEGESSGTIGGVSFAHGARRSFVLCQLCCGGFTGLHASGKWSTWSPGRFPVPKEENELVNELMRAIPLYQQRPPLSEGESVPLIPGLRFFTTCGNCQIICWGDKKKNTENLKLLHNSGCVIQRPDGELLVLPPDEASKEFEKLPPEHRNLYL